MLSDEYVMKAAGRMESAAQQMSAAADRMEIAVQKFEQLLGDGYGGNGVRLLEALEKLPEPDKK